MTTETFNKISAIARVAFWSQGTYIWCGRDEEKYITALCRADGMRVTRITLPSRQVKLFAH